MGIILKSINKAAFVIAPVFWQVVYMAVTFCLRAVVFLAVTKIFDNKIPPELKASVWGMMLAFLMMPLPLRAPNPVSVTGWARDIPAVSYRGEYDEVEQQLFLARQDVNYNYQQLEVLQQQKNMRWAKSLIFDVALPLVWAAGVSVSLIVYTGGIISLKSKIRKQATPAPQFRPAFEKRKAILGSKTKAKVLTAPFVSSPSVANVLHPVILLPKYTNSLSDEQQEYILIHETGHIRGGDLWVNALIGLLGCVYWFIRPFFSLTRNDIEAANDSYVIRRLEKEDVPAYSKTLVTVLAHSLQGGYTPGLVSMAGEKTNMEKRIKLIKQWEFFNKHRMLFTAATALTMIALGMLFFTAGVDKTNTVTIEMEDYNGTGELFDIVVTYDNSYIYEAEGDRQKSHSFSCDKFGSCSILVHTILKAMDIDSEQAYLQKIKDFTEYKMGDILSADINGRKIYYSTLTFPPYDDTSTGCCYFIFKISDKYGISGQINMDNNEVDVLKVFDALFKDVHLKTKPNTYVTELSENDRLIMSALLGETPIYIYNGESNRPFYITDIPALFDPNDRYMDIWNFSAPDMDRDGENEAVISVFGSAGDMGGYVIINREKGNVYGCTAGSRDLISLKTDGSYFFTDPTGMQISAIAVITGFSQTSYFYDVTAYAQGNNGSWEKFVIYKEPSAENSSRNGYSQQFIMDKNTATEDEFMGVYSRQQEKQDVMWYDFTPAYINSVFGRLAS